MTSKPTRGYNHWENGESVEPPTHYLQSKWNMKREAKAYQRARAKPNLLTMFGTASRHTGMQGQSVDRFEFDYNGYSVVVSRYGGGDQVCVILEKGDYRDSKNMALSAVDRFLEGLK